MRLMVEYDIISLRQMDIEDQALLRTERLYKNFVEDVPEGQPQYSTT